MPYKAIIFDCDGTLVDSEELNCKSCADVITEAGFTGYDYNQIYKDFVGIQLQDIFDLLEEKEGRKFPFDARARFIELANQNGPKYLRRIDGARRLIEKVQFDYKICVASNGERENVINSLKTTDLKEFFPEYDGYEGTSAWENKNIGAIHAAWNVPQQRVDDTLNDVSERIVKHYQRRLCLRFH